MRNFLFSFNYRKILRILMFKNNILNLLCITLTPCLLRKIRSIRIYSLEMSFFNLLNKAFILHLCEFVSFQLEA